MQTETLKTDIFDEKCLFIFTWFVCNTIFIFIPKMITRLHLSVFYLWLFFIFAKNAKKMLKRKKAPVVQNVAEYNHMDISCLFFQHADAAPVHLLMYEVA